MKKAVIGLTLTAVVVAAIVFSADLTATALSLRDALSGTYRGEGQPTDLFGNASAVIPRVINLMLFIVGILAIFMIIYGGIRYVLSGGDNKKVTDAKNTVLYAIVGLVVAILGYAIVNWISGVLGATGSNQGGGSVVLLMTTLLS